MKTHSLIVKIIVPKFRAIGYNLLSPRERPFRFYNYNRSILIEYDIISRFAPKGYMEELKLSLSLKYGRQWITFRPERLSTAKFSSTYFITESNPSEWIEQITSDIICLIVPKLEEISQAIVWPETEHYEMLSIFVKQRTIPFAKQHDLSVNWSNDIQNWIYAWFQNKMPESAEKRKQIFQNDLDEFIEVTAFIGELVGLKNGWNWRWATIPETTERIFILCSSDIMDGFNPLDAVVRFWNFSSDLKEIVLFPPEASQ